MNNDNFLFIIIICLLIVCGCLIWYIIKIKKILNNIVIILEDIEKGNSNRKIVVKDNDAASVISYKINAIVAKDKAEITELRKSQKAYKKLLTSLSHDVRTPLTSLIGYIDALANKLPEEEEREEYLSIAQKKAYDLKEFVDILFEWFKLDSKERKFNFEKTDVNELTRSIIADWIPIFDKNNIKLNANIPEADCNIMVDISAYNRIINNIIQNSIAHSSGDTISIESSCDEVSVLIKVSDNGKGIDEKDIPYIFDRLYKCDEARSYKGSGLGLSIVKELVTAINGTIDVFSTINNGTTFIIKLPVKK